MENRVAEFIRQHGLFAGAEGILVAVSGGADSMSLLHMLKSLQVEGHLQSRLVCVHVNHRLRGQASDADERFVVEQAKDLGLHVVARAVEVREYARTHKLSIETAARQLRLASLVEVAREHDCSWIATGHQRNDNAETVVHRLRRGTGFRGLAGIRPIRQLDDDLWLGRPLLCVTHDEIIRYLRDRGLSWREDHTNADTIYTRNYIRHSLLPLLQQDSRGSIVEGLSDLATVAARLRDRVLRETQQAWAKLVQTDRDEVRIEARGVTSQPELIAVELIRRGLVSLGCGERDLTEGHYRGVLQLAQLQVAGKQVSLPNGFSARLESDRILLRRNRSRSSGVGQDASCALTVPGRTRFGEYEIHARIIERREIDPAKIFHDKSPFSEYLDWDRIRPPIVVRPRQRGDRFRPLGLDAEKKVGKFLTTARVPRDVRERAIVFADQEQILWVCPVRLAEPVKIMNETRLILELTVRNM